MQIKYKSIYYDHIKRGEDNYGAIFTKSVIGLAEALEKKMETSRELTFNLVKATFDAVKNDIIKIRMKDAFYEEVFTAVARSWEYGELIERWSSRILKN